MKKEIPVDGEFRIDALAAKMPVEPRADFSRRVFEALAEEIAEERLAEMPALPSPDFASRVMAAIAAEEKAKNNTAAFPRAARFFRSARGFAVGAAAAIAVGVGLFSLPRESLSERVENVLAADPELAQLAAADDDFTLDELFAASRLLTVLDENSAETAELFVYYEN